MSDMFGKVHIAVLVLKCEELIFMSVCHLFSCISPTPSMTAPPSSVIVTFPSTGKCFKCPCTHACTHCSVAVSVVVGHDVPLLKILARPHSWIMLLRNRSE